MTKPTWPFRQPNIYNAYRGVDGPGFKSWYIDSTVSGHFGVGPDPVSELGYTPEWWSAPENAKPGLRDV